MLKTCLILALLALTGADANCSCYTTKDSVVSGKKIGLSNAFDSSDFNACYVSGGCGFIAYSGDPTVGWSNISVTFQGTTDSTGVFTIYSGNTSASSAYITKFSAADSTKTISFTSPTPFIYVLYTQETTTANTYFGNIMAGSPLTPLTTTVAPTTAPTTTPFVSTLYAKNPQLISHDLMVLVNQKTTGGAAALSAINSLATQFVNLLSVSTSSSLSGTTQTRLGLATLTPYTPNYAAQGEIWSMSAPDVVSALPKSGISSDVNIANALTSVVTAFFNVSDPTAPTRRNVQRSVILFTAWWNSDDLSTLKDLFASKGVNLAVVTYSTTTSALVPNKWYNYADLTNTTAQDVASFVNRFYLNSRMNNILTNNWCQKGDDPSTTNPTITEPSDYAGPPTTGTTWTIGDGQRSRYCNFQDTTYTYQRSDPTKNVQVTVYYELEIEQDYLKFYADNVEVESFTGMDVNQANFVVNASTILAKFTTDSSGVLRGFSATFAEV